MADQRRFVPRERRAARRLLAHNAGEEMAKAERAAVLTARVERVCLGLARRHGGRVVAGPKALRVAGQPLVPKAQVRGLEPHAGLEGLADDGTHAVAVQQDHHGEAAFWGGARGPEQIDAVNMSRVGCDQIHVSFA